MIKDYKWYKIGTCFVAFICFLLMCATIYFTPNFVAIHFSSDGILEQTTISLINFIRLDFGILSTIGLLISTLYVIKPHIIKKLYLNSNHVWILKLAIFLFPIVFIICTVLLKSNCPGWYRKLMTNEDSIIEWLTFIFYFIAFIISFSISTTFYKRNSVLFFFMYLLLSIGFFFIAMEEISWGQRILNLKTPEILGYFNRQNEINFHNIKGFPLHALFIIVGLYGAFSRFIIPNKVKIKYGSIVNLFVPSYHLFFYFFFVGSFYLYYDQLNSIGVILFGDRVGWLKDHFMYGKDQEPAEFLLSCGFLLFVIIHKYRQASARTLDFS